MWTSGKDENEVKIRWWGTAWKMKSARALRWLSCEAAGPCGKIQFWKVVGRLNFFMTGTLRMCLFWRVLCLATKVGIARSSRSRSIAFAFETLRKERLFLFDAQNAQLGLSRLPSTLATGDELQCPLPGPLTGSSSMYFKNLLRSSQNWFRGCSILGTVRAVQTFLVVRGFLHFFLIVILCHTMHVFL